MSNLIKSGRVVALEDLKTLELISRFTPNAQNSSAAGGESEGNRELDVETQTWKDRILRDAEQAAQEILQQAREEAGAIRSAAESEIEAWWNARRAEDEAVVQNARQAGFEEGYKAGAEHAERELRLEWEDRLKEAEKLIQLAYTVKEKVIAEAESFVVGLSCSIAGKLVSAQLEQNPELALKLFSQALSRRQEQGVITLCVSPSQFEFVQAAKDELALSLDSQAELQIVPDPSVGKGGCIIRSSFGSVDARIDTQLSAVRDELLRVAAQAAEEGDSHAAS